MIEAEATLAALFIILALGLIVPELFKKLRLPFVSVLILLGAFLGPNGFNYVKSGEVIEFLGFLGMTFLMLMAGIETDLHKVRKFKNKVFIMSLVNGLIPFTVGILITKFFGYSWTVSFIVGIVFISSSVAIVIPSLRDAKIFDKKIGQLILSSVLLADIASLIALGFIFQSASPITKLPLPLYFIILIFSIFFILLLISKIAKLTFKKISDEKGYESRLRFIIALMMFSLIYFSLLGVHPILASFLVGITLSGFVHKDKSGVIYSKIHTLAYGLFIPIFFFVVGMEIDLSLFKQFDISNILMISLILGLILSKLFSGIFAGNLVKLNKTDSLLFGTVSTVQLTTTLAVTFAASTLGLLDSVIVTSIILLSVITTIFGPIAVSIIAKKYNK